MAKQTQPPPQTPRDVAFAAMSSRDSISQRYEAYQRAKKSRKSSTSQHEEKRDKTSKNYEITTRYDLYDLSQQKKKATVRESSRQAVVDSMEVTICACYRSLPYKNPALLMVLRIGFSSK